MSDSDNSEAGIGRKSFNAGLKRKRIDFIPAREPSTASPTVASHSSLGEQYLSITLKNRSSPVSKIETGTASTIEACHGNDREDCLAENAVCRICNLPVDAGSIESGVTHLRHEASLAHQACLEHSNPPSHLDRNRQGLKYLSSYGWDPDSHWGLGPTGAGIRAPVKVKAKHDTVGLGVRLPESNHRVGEKEAKLDAKGLRKKAREEKVKRERLQQMFYATEEMNQYLGIG